MGGARELVAVRVHWDVGAARWPREGQPVPRQKAGHWALASQVGGDDDVEVLAAVAIEVHALRRVGGHPLP